MRTAKRYTFDTVEGKINEDIVKKTSMLDVAWDE